MEQELRLLQTAPEGRGRPAVVLGGSEDGDQIGVSDPAGLVEMGGFPHGHSRRGEDAGDPEEEDEEGDQDGMPTNEAHPANLAKQVLETSCSGGQPSKDDLAVFLHHHQVDAPVGPHGEVTVV